MTLTDIPIVRFFTRTFATLLLLATATTASAQRAEQEAVIAVADSLLAALSRGDRATIALLTLDSAVVGGAGERNGVERLSLRSWRFDIDRLTSSAFTERGFDATATVQDRVAQVWMPYDLYAGGKWSHCGVDVFTLMKREGRWRVAALIYTIEQPPACRRHPAGPPGA